MVIAIICMLLALFLPSVRLARESARRMQCNGHLKTLALALHNYHDTFGYLPAVMGGSGVGATPLLGNANRLSGVVALLPYLEQAALWKEISQPAQCNGVRFPAMGPAPWVSDYTPWTREIDTLRCPSAAGEQPEQERLGRTNYAFSIGDQARGIHRSKHLRGVFACGMTSRFGDIVDGLGNTLMLTEMGATAGRGATGQFAVNQPSRLLDNPRACLDLLASNAKRYDQRAKLAEGGRGSRWADGAAGYSLVNTILPPNSPSCSLGADGYADGLYSAGSLHPHGVNAAYADGSVHFISEDIDAGDPAVPTLTVEQMVRGAASPSPYGVWVRTGDDCGRGR